MIFSLKVGRLQAAVKKNHQPIKTSFLVTWKLKWVQKESLKMRFFWVVGQWFCTLRPVKQREALGFLQLLLSVKHWAVAGHELCWILSKCRRSLTLCHSCNQLCSSKPPSTDEERVSHCSDLARTAWRVTGTPGKGAQALVRYLALLKGSAEPSLMGEKEKNPECSGGSVNSIAFLSLVTPGYQSLGVWWYRPLFVPGFSVA